MGLEIKSLSLSLSLKLIFRAETKKSYRAWLDNCLILAQGMNVSLFIFS